MLSVNVTYGSQAHLTHLHSHHNHHRRTEEGCTVHYCIYTPHLCMGHASGFDLCGDNISPNEKPEIHLVLLKSEVGVTVV